MGSELPDHHRLFSHGAETYSRFRPDYPTELYNVILEFAGIAPGSKGSLAVDVATGQGQAALQLAQHFQRIIALDASTEQLAHARRAPNVEYKTADAHATGLPDGCADLVTAASALHWFDQPRFYREARRIHKPGSGTLAAWAIPLGLATISVPGQAPAAGEAATAALRHLHSARLGPYWSSKRLCVDNMYRGVEPTASDFHQVRLEQLVMQRQLTIQQLVGYVSSWSSYSSYCKTHPGAATAGDDPVQEFQAALLQALSTQDVDATLVVHIPLALVMAKGPCPL